VFFIFFSCDCKSSITIRCRFSPEIKDLEASASIDEVSLAVRRRRFPLQPLPRARRRPGHHRLTVDWFAKVDKNPYLREVQTWVP
jgi:hypothetical protein